jgi:hypothetical protein
MNRRNIALGTAVVVVALFGLYVAMSKDDDVAPPREPAGRKISQTDPGKPAVKGTRPQPAEGARPALPARSAPADPAVSEYMVGDVRVRDHRTGDHAPIDVPPSVHPPEGRKIPSQLTSDIARQLRAVVSECAASVPPGDRGATSHLDGQIMISIKDQQATITSATFQPRDVASTSRGPVKECLEQKSIGVGVPSGDEADVEGYGITLSLRFP